MPFHFISDIHIDTYRPSVRQEICESLAKGGEAILIPGDIANSPDLIAWTLSFFARNYDHVIYTPGNHDLYLDNFKPVPPGSPKTPAKRLEILREYIRENTPANVHFLGGDFVEVAGKKIWGSPILYSDEFFTWLPREERIALFKREFRGIVDWWHWRAEDAVAFYEEHKKKLAEAVKEADIILTHTQPSVRENHINPMYRGNPMNCCFLFDGVGLIKKDARVKTWIFGHVHSPISFREKGVEFFCNPFGYPSEKTFRDVGVI